jgi:hypothetical protein
VCAGLAFGLLGWASRASAQCPYQATQGQGTIVPGDTDTSNHIDDGQTLITLPFSWSLYGVPYTDVNVCSNGNLQFGTPSGTFPAAYNNDCLPSTTQVTGPMICPHWDDLRTDIGTTGIFTSVSGTAPDRIFNIEWRAVYFSNTAQTANFEARLYEGQSRFDFIYGQVDQAGTSATIGLQASGAGPFTQFACGTGGITSGMMLSFACPSSYPPSCSLTTSLDHGAAGTVLSAFARVALGAGPTSTGLTVTLDAGPINGGTVNLHDDGVAPDVAAGDNIYSGSATVGAAAVTGSQTLTSTVHDAQARTSTCTARFSVLPTGCNGEEEPCGVNYPDTFDGGCNSTPYVWAMANLNADYCGSCANSTSYRDTDWWLFTLPATANGIIVAGSAQFAAQCFIAASTCPFALISPVQTSGSNGDISFTYGPLAPGGSYTFFISPQGFDGSAVCGQNDTYNFRLTATQFGACCSGTSCQITNSPACASSGGTFAGMGTDCGGGSYNITSSSGTFVDISGTGTQEPITSACDDCCADVPLPFAFSLFGNAYNDVWISSNGNLQFGTTPNTAFVNDSPPTTAAPNNAIYPLWDDLYFTTGGIYYQTDGTAPTRRFTVAWINRQQYARVGTSETFECILYEGSNNIEFRYGTLDADAGGEQGPGGSDYTVGVENSDGTVAFTIMGSELGTGNTARMVTFVPGVNPCVPTACWPDFNCDGDTGTDADIEAFFACIAGVCPPPPCNHTADFNGDGDAGTDADIEAFFRVLAGGHC